MEFTTNIKQQKRIQIIAKPSIKMSFEMKMISSIVMFMRKSRPLKVKARVEKSGDNGQHSDIEIHHIINSLLLWRHHSDVGLLYLGSAQNSTE